MYDLLLLELLKLVFLCVLLFLEFFLLLFCVFMEMFNMDFLKFCSLVEREGSVVCLVNDVFVDLFVGVEMLSMDLFKFFNFDDKFSLEVEFLLKDFVVFCFLDVFVWEMFNIDLIFFNFVDMFFVILEKFMLSIVFNMEGFFFLLFL